MEEMLLGVTDRTVLVFISDPASTTGAGKAGLAHTDITVTYTRVETDNDVVHTDVTSSLNALTNLTDAHNDWGWKEVSSTLSKGLYRLDIADAVFASGAWYAVVQVTITSGTAAATPKAFRLVAVNALDGVRMGLTALPNAAADAAGGLPISDAGGLDLDAKVGSLTFTVAGKVDANATHLSGDSVAADNAEAFFDGTGYAGTNNVIPLVTTTTTATNVTTVNGLAANVITAAATAADFGAEIADAVWDEVLSGHLTGGSTGNALNAAGSAGDPWSTSLPGAYSAGSAGYIIGTNLDAAVSSRGTSTLTQTQVTGGAYALNSASFAFNSGLDFTTTQKAATLARVTLVDTTTTNTDMRGTDNAATAANLATVAGYLDTEIAAILEDTGTTLPAQITALNNLSAAQVRTELSTELARIDVATSTRMATYTQPTGFLAATFPTTVASTTNITAGTITTVTNLTNLPAITSNWLTAAGIAADAGTEIAAAVLAAGDIDGYSLEEAQKLQLAALVGEVSGAATTTVVIRAADDSKARITATVDADGNRTALTLDETG